MTRPNIVRADTIDLQDEEHPTAASHQRPVLQGGLAPHQRAEVDHVMEERNSEEHALQDAWNISDNLTDEPGAIDQAHQAHQLTSEHSTINGSEEGGEGGGSDVDADDDLDRISSSPSIDDGGYLPHSSPLPSRPTYRLLWPKRTSSLSPAPRTPTPTCETFNQSANSPSSSPFLHTPQHLPLHARKAGKGASPLDQRGNWSPSPCDYRSRHLAMTRTHRADEACFFESCYHHPRGRYKPDPETIQELEEDEGEVSAPYEETPPADTDEDLSDANEESAMYVSGDDALSESSVLVHDMDLEKSCIESPFCSNQFTQSIIYLPPPTLEKTSSPGALENMDLQDFLLPTRHPLFDRPHSPTDSTGSWESLLSSGEDTDSDDDSDAFFDDLEDRFIDSGWGGECLRDAEDIDFEFVYALHTFVATVEGQANATKGDTMVLLDDSNSYWWLVRVVKDSSIGYLPAEHIETPTERLARLNKHRNIDLSATMLSDNSEKSRNPLRKIRRKKQVQFAAPTYVEASDYDYSSDEDESGAAEAYSGTTQPEDAQRNADPAEQQQAVDTAASQDDQARTSTSSRGSFDREQAATIADDPQLSPKLADKTEAAPLKSKRTRNTDSFLKDDNNETRKITLTPGLLREDSISGKSVSSDSTRNGSLENLVKQVSPTDGPQAPANKKEKKEKKGGMLSGLFKSKKKSKSKDDYSDQSDADKPSGEYSRESPMVSPLASGRSSPSPEDIRRQDSQSKQARGKLQTITPVQSSSPQREIPQEQPQEQIQQPSIAPVAELQGSEAAHEMQTTSLAPLNIEAAQQDKSKDGPLTPITNMLKRDDSKSQKPAKAKRAKQRVELDDFDSPDEEDGSSSPLRENEDGEGDRLSESPIEITHNMHGTDSIHIPTPSPYDQPGVEDDDEPGSLTSSPSLIEHPAEPLEGSEVHDDNDSTPKAPRSPNPVTVSSSKPSTLNRDGSTDSATTQSSKRLSPATTTSQQSWSDSSLRAWLEDGSEVKDMMVLIHDKSGVVAVSDDHPMMAGLFTEQRKGVQSMMGELDGLLGSYLQRKGISFR